MNAITPFLGNETIEDYALRSLSRRTGTVPGVPVLNETRHKGIGHAKGYKDVRHRDVNLQSALTFSCFEK